MPKTALINVYPGGYARGPDGSLVVSGSAYSGESQATTFYAWVSPDCRIDTVVRLSPFNPEAAVVAADGVVWLAGTERGRSPEEPFNRDSHAVRRFDRSGKLLGSFFPASMLGANPAWPAKHPADSSRLVASRDRIGWFVPLAKRYIEFSLEGKIIGQYGVPQEVSSYNATPYPALCDDGGVFLGHIQYGKTGGAAGWGIFSLDRNTGTWRFAPQAGKWGMVYGCDGNLLATTTDIGTINWLGAAPQR